MSRNTQLKELGHAVRLFINVIYFAIISVKIQLFFRATQKEIYRTTGYDIYNIRRRTIISFFKGGGGREFSGA